MATECRRTKKRVNRNRLVRLLTIPDNIYNLSVSLEIKQDILWKLVNELERKVAKRRGLV